MEPAIALVYNSRGGNGPLGMGWSMSGFSSIHRCPRTQEQDGIAVGVNFTSSDRLCLDGQRLVKVSGANYGDSGAQYRTEIDSFARVTQIGGNLEAPSTCFRVERKDGRIFHYGAVATSASACQSSSANARVKPAGITKPLSWLVEKIEDRIGNYQLYSYDASAGNGEVLPGKITYTGFGSTAGDRSVEFTYQLRSSIAGATDIASTYLAGGLTMQTRALLAIETKVPGAGGTFATIRRIQPTYVASPYSGRLQVSQIKECAYDGATPYCHPPTKFETTSDYSGPASQRFHLAKWNTLGGTIQPLGRRTPIFDQDVSRSATEARAYVPSDIDPNGITQAARIIGDLDGDGTRETVIGLIDASGVRHDYVAQLQANRETSPAVEVTSGVLCYTWDCYGDFAGDGRSEVVVLPHPGDPGVLRFAVWTGARGDIATTNPLLLLQSNIPYTPTIVSNPDLDPAGYAAIHAVDLNGDGLTDILVERNDSSCGTDGAGSKRGVFAYVNNTQVNPMTGTIDSTHLPNFIIPSSALKCLGRSVAGSQIIHEERVSHVADFDGNGSPDIFVTMSETGGADLTKVIPLTPSGSTAVTTGAEMSCSDIGLVSSSDLTDECHWSNGYSINWIDVNGDGLEDFVIARPNQGEWKLRLNTGGHLGGVITPTGTGSHAGLDNYQDSDNPNQYHFKYAGRLPTMDADGDGKTDLLAVSAANGFAVKLCTLTFLGVQDHGDADKCPVDTVGPPNGGQNCVTWACPQDPGTGTFSIPGVHNINFPNSARVWNHDGAHDVVFPMYGSNESSNGFTTPNVAYADSSAYHLAMIKFVQTGVASFEARLLETSMISTLSSAYPWSSQDVFGDGLNDLVGNVGCEFRPYLFPQDGVTYNGCLNVGSAGNGPDQLPIYDAPAATTPTNVATSTFATTNPFHVNQNVGAKYAGSARMLASFAPVSKPTPFTTDDISASGLLPDLMWSATNGVGDYARWAYSVLGDGGSQGDLPIYSVPTNTRGYKDKRHYYFTSSMPIVIGMSQNNGIGGEFGFRAAVYGYAEAVYNHYGRGFQGFRAITQWLASNDVTRQTRTVTTYNQKFPLTGKVASVESRVGPAAGVSTAGHRILTESDTWICSLSRDPCPQGDDLTIPADAVYAPALDLQIATRYDPVSDSAVGSTVIVNAVNSSAKASGWDAYGNLKNQLITQGETGTNAFVQAQTVATTNSYVPADTINWWLDRLSSSSVVQDITFKPVHSLPSGSVAPTRTLNTSYTWNSDRTPQSRTIQPGVLGQQQMTTWGYPSPSYGLPTTVSIMGSQASPATRTVTYGYTKDGVSPATSGYYFVLTTQNPLFQTTTTEHSVADGQVKKTTDANGLRTIAVYDAFGRAIRTDYKDASDAALLPSIYVGYARCAAGSCPTAVYEGAYEDDAAWRVTQVQTGAPTEVSWYDALGRIVKHAKRGFDGTFILGTSEYDDMNTVVFQSAPFHAGDTVYLTGWNYDVLSRPTQKVVSGGIDMDPTHGDVVTTYGYDGHKTAIKVRAQNVSAACSSSTNLCMDMTRTYDVLGRLEQTTQNSGATANYAVTNYWYDGPGNTVALQDAEGNVIKATYDDLGRRVSVIDPDAGTKTFSYNGLSELQTQTDARGVQTAFTYDALSRPLTRTATDNSAVAPLPKVIRDTWLYDPTGATGGLGLLGTAKRETGASTGALAQIHLETDRYEQYTKRLSTQTQTLDGQAGSWLTSHTYDMNGREQTTTYPSGQVVKHDYTTFGELNSLSDNTTGSVYWTANAKDAWGNVTGESWTGGITGTHIAYASTGQLRQQKWTNGATILDRLDYTYDSFGNLTKQQSSQGAASEAYGYDGLQRITQATRTPPVYANCATQPWLCPSPVLYAYTPSGNIQSKSDVGTYNYAGAGCGPHFVSSISNPDPSFGIRGLSYQCDASGNVVGGSMLNNGRYDFANLPWYIERRSVGGLPAGQAAYLYDAGSIRFKEVTNTQTTWYGPAGFERTFVSPQSTDRIELGPVTLQKNGAAITVRPNLKDRLGSTVAIGNADGTLWQTRTYDVFGKPRNGDQSDRSDGTLALSPPTLRGFTGHEHVDDLRLIHMNGRMYDPQLGRFLSVDPVIQFPSNGQSLNPYSYILNNPLAGRDPSGYCPTGTNIHQDAGPTCKGLGVSQTQVATPSVSAIQAAKASAQSNGGPVAQISDGSGAAKNAHTDPSSQMTQANAPTAQPGQPSATEPVRADGAIGLDAIRVTPDGSRMVDYAAAYEQWLYPDYLRDFRAWDERRIAGETFRGLVWEAYEKPAITLAVGWYFSGLVADIMYLNEGAATFGAASVGDVGTAARPVITRPYVRPRGTPTAAQRASVQGQPCVDCGVTMSRQVADHITPLVREYYETGVINLQRAKSLESVQPQCPTCSARQGAAMSRYSIEKREEYGLDGQ